MPEATITVSEQALCEAVVAVLMDRFGHPDSDEEILFSKYSAERLAELVVERLREKGAVFT